MPRIENLSDYVSTQVSVPAVAASGAAFTATVIDASGGFDRVRHVISVGVIVAGGGFDAEVTESATSGGTYTLIASSGATAITTTATTKLIVIDVPVNSAKPFQKLRATSTTATVTIAAIAEMYNGSRVLPTADASTVQKVTV